MWNRYFFQSEEANFLIYMFKNESPIAQDLLNNTYHNKTTPKMVAGNRVTACCRHFLPDDDSKDIRRKRNILQQYWRFLEGHHFCYCFTIIKFLSLQCPLFMFSDSSVPSWPDSLFFYTPHNISLPVNRNEAIWSGTVEHNIRSGELSNTGVLCSFFFVQFRTIPWGRDLKTDLTNPRVAKRQNFIPFK